ncbi:hypothetical protein [Robertkochia sediminum]|uniref:hypothetical protein n=1 Tax=Robertkochia sediminum TaxID=2785326 RepID=UPI0019340B4A|nr:hypothetical protein [Robertkochia sediminum]MBL7473226.1 hypothetical protein [Robertkochia sediminum]
MNTENKPTVMELQRAQVFHRDAEDWLSEIDFMEDEMAFFGELLKNYFMALAEKDWDEEKVLIKHRRMITTEIELMRQRINEHHGHLTTLIDQAHPESQERALEAEHYEVATGFKELRKEFNRYKKDLFTNVGEVLKEKKQKRLTH